MDKVEPQESRDSSGSGEELGMSEKNPKAIAVVETPAKNEIDAAGAGQPGNWHSKVGISIPNFGKWNPSSFKVPTIPTMGTMGSVAWKMAKFYGPGAIVSVAYIDPDNYQTDIAAGAQFQYKLLFMILLSNIMAIYLQVSHELKIGKCEVSPPDNFLIGAFCETGSHNWHDFGGDASNLSS
jgi:hypothetical protein